MTITDEMTEAALVKWFRSETTWHVGMAPWAAEQFRDEMKEALSAALSVPAAAVVGEPVAWEVRTEDETFVGIYNFKPNAEQVSYYRQRVTPLYAAPSAPEGWQPIDSAPKDWSDVLLFDPEYDDEWRQVFEGYYSCEDGGRGCWVDAGNQRVNPTHWRPLPSPPSTHSSDKGSEKK